MRMLPIILIVALCLSPGWAADTSDSTLQALASDDYASRQTASAALLADDDLDVDDLVALYRQAWSPEQRQRLLAVAYHHCLALTRQEIAPAMGDGAMGITQKGMSADQLPELGRPAVAVMSTFPGFPGHAHLQAGDLILSVNDRGFPNHLAATNVSAEFGRMVREVQAGQELTLSVLRQGRVLTVRLRLASLDALNQMYGQHRIVDERFLARWRTVERQMSGSDPPLTPISISRPQRQPLGLNVQ